MDMDLSRQPHAAEFWPVEHPMEPQDEDRPVKCPMFASSSSIDDGKAAESPRKRLEQPTMVNNGTAGMTMTAEPPVRAVRKRHHTLTHDNHITSESLIGKSSLPPIPPQTLTISQMLKQFDQV